MTKIFKQLGRHWAACLVVIALLIVQAYCDLSLGMYRRRFRPLPPNVWRTMYHAARVR